MTFYDIACYLIVINSACWCAPFAHTIRLAATDSSAWINRLDCAWLKICFFAPATPDRGAKYCDQRVCMPVCLTVCSRLKDHMSQFSVRVISLICGLGSVLLWRQWSMLCTFGFVDDVMFSHNGANWPK